MASLTLSFEQVTIDNLSTIAKCTAIEGVEVSQEELDALREASAFGGGAGNEDAADYFGAEAKKSMTSSLVKSNTIHNSSINVAEAAKGIGSLNMGGSKLQKQASVQYSMTNNLASKPPVQPPP